MMILGDSRGGALDLGGEDVFADFAHRAEAGGAGGHEVSGCEGGRHGTGGGDANAGPSNGRRINVVVAHVDALGGGEAEGGGELLESAEFVDAALDEVRDFEFGGAGGGGAGGSAADPRDGDAGFVQANETHAVEDGERFGLGTVRGNLHRAIGEHAVDVHGEEANGGPARRTDSGGVEHGEFSVATR